ncbi:uncharacterized protein K444DRAFT_413705 [Hyaloscypha bicolor E]|uniref:Post-transcriptional regulator MKT1 N-terminal domain-containing protein n=1 Tax=Hyaloscypha bicolor E TaxID=1095630 RepID=A0A2J6T6G1_9HELO|nr:uncharacterized protein K444DRAFT_413705 [Hyaloscypha bicolor E]PMD58612.1 hypothetical protein K444DRAFT_413705 [Hyaloscypha bicolor E]
MLSVRMRSSWRLPELRSRRQTMLGPCMGRTNLRKLSVLSEHQLAYLLNEHENGNAYIDTVMGSRELLLYNIDPLILPITPADWENKTFRGLSKEHIIDALNIDHNRSPDFLEDALLMAGTSFLPTFPALLDTEMYKEPPTLLNILNLLRAQEKSVDKASRFFETDLKLRDPKWYDKYMKAKMGLRHPVTMTLEGAVVTKEWDKLTGDNNQYLGLQLPLELHFYLSTALVGPRTLNYFVSLKSVVFPTLDGVTSDEYKRFGSMRMPSKLWSIAICKHRSTRRPILGESMTHCSARIRASAVDPELCHSPSFLYRLKTSHEALFPGTRSLDSIPNPKSSPMPYGASSISEDMSTTSTN